MPFLFYDIISDMAYYNFSVEPLTSGLAGLYPISKWP